MADKTGIEWTERTLNFVTGCTKISPGCDNCYMFREYPRLNGMGVKGYQAEPDVITLLPERLEEIKRWREPQMVFLNSMSDIFHPQVPFGLLVRAFEIFADHPQHVFQALTKRPKTMAYFAKKCLGGKWPPNVWAMTSVESPDYTWRIEALADVPADVRGLSVEPILSGVDLSPWLEWLNWVIVGGESGPGARPVHPDWLRSIRDQCLEFKVPFFFKQWGEYVSRPGNGIGAKVWLASDGRVSDKPVPGYAAMYKLGRKIAGAEFDGRSYKAFPVVA